MLDGRVKTLHPRVHGGILADRRHVDHRRQLVAAAIAPFELVVVNLYPFAAAAARPGIELDALVEEIDIGGPSMVRAAAKNHASVAIVTSPERYPAILAALAEEGSVPAGMRAAARDRGVPPHGRLRRTDRGGAAAPDGGAGVDLPPDPGLPGSPDPYPPTLTIALEKVETLRYGENPHQPAARYRRPGQRPEAGPFATGGPTLQGKALSYNNVLDASAAAALAGPSAARPASSSSTRTRAARPSGQTLLEAWEAALAGDPVSAFGGVVALTRPVDAAVAGALASIFLEVVVAPAYRRRGPGHPRVQAQPAGPRPPAARDRHGPGRRRRRPARSGPPADPCSSRRPTSCPTIRRAGGSSAPGHPTDRERRDLDLAWRLCRGATSNAIVLVRDGRLIGLGSGQTSRVDAARQAVEKARAISGPDATTGAVCASDAFFPFADAVEACLAGGVTAFVQPGGSVRDAEVIETVDRASASMLVTEVRHFRH